MDDSKEADDLREFREMNGIEYPFPEFFQDLQVCTGGYELNLQQKSPHQAVAEHFLKHHGQNAPDRMRRCLAAASWLDSHIDELDSQPEHFICLHFMPFNLLTLGQSQLQSRGCVPSHKGCRAPQARIRFQETQNRNRPMDSGWQSPVIYEWPLLISQSQNLLHLVRRAGHSPWLLP